MSLDLTTAFTVSGNCHLRARGMAAMQHSWGLSRLSISRRSQDPCWHRAPAPRVAAGRVSLCCNAVQSGAGGTAAAAAQTAGPLPTADRDKVAAAEAALVEALLAIQGRGRGTSAKQQQEVGAAVTALEDLKGVPNATSSPLLDGTWELVYTTRPGTASPIQRTFVGVDAFTVFQDLSVVSTQDKRVRNIVRFSEKIGELTVEAAASVQDEKRILFQFDRAAFSFKFLPFKVPYPVPFRLLGDEAKGWLDITYLSPSGAIRIARGNKGTTFVLQKGLDSRQQLLRAISAGANVEKAIEDFLAQHPKELDLDILGGKWRNIWSSQAANANWLQRSTMNFSNWQIISPDDETLENLVEFFPGVKLRAEAKTEAVNVLAPPNSRATAQQRRGVLINGAAVEIGGIRIPLPGVTGEGHLDIVYIDNKLRISRGNKGSLFVHIRD